MVHWMGLERLPAICTLEHGLAWACLAWKGLLGACSAKS